MPRQFASSFYSLKLLFSNIVYFKMTKIVNFMEDPEKKLNRPSVGMRLTKIILTLYFLPLRSNKYSFCAGV